MTVINLALFGAALWCAAVIGGWAAVGTNTDRPTRTGLDVLEQRGDDDA
ncbi:hypothetical protein [Tsukamurella pseudospumae]|nr:hypothetical protein [Tsukamurella pseudospumae]